MDERMKTLLFSYFSGKYTPEEEARIEEWLKEDEKHKALYAEMAEWWAAAHVPLFMSDMQAGFEEKFWKMEADSFPSVGKSHHLFKTTLRIAAAILLLLSVGAGSYYLGKSGMDKGRGIYSYQTYVPYGSQSQVTLPDQSKVWLNAGSTLVYREETNGGSREVTLEGEAYFEIITDTVHPLIVRSDNVSIVVKGTSFNVRAYKEDDILDVTLVKGKVQVKVEEKEEIELFPDNLLSYNKHTHQTDIVYVNGEDMFAWKNGMLKFHHQSFNDIAKILERKYNIQVDIQSEVLKKEIFTGSFSANYSLERILGEIDVDKKYRWTRSGSEVVIRDK